LRLDARVVSNEPEEEPDLVSDDDDDDSRTIAVAVCAHLTKLTRLQDFTVDGDNMYSFKYPRKKLMRGDALALTALTSLTRLVLDGAEHGVGTAVTTALALNLQQLQSLHFGGCCLQLGSAEGVACLEAIGRLTQLTQLSFWGAEGLTQHGLMQLTGLSRLQRAACVDLCYEDMQVTDEAMASFWAAVHAQRL
jgi:hypothetical protein